MERRRSREARARRSVRGRASPKASRLTRKALYESVWSHPLNAVAAELGISGNGLAKICDRVMIPCPKRGYWAKVQAGKKPAREPLPAAPASVGEWVTISSERAASRRTRTRLSREARAEQLIEAAGKIIGRDGLPAATMKRVAREIGLSEAQAYNYFKSQKELLIALARRELAAMNSVRLGEIGRIDDHLTRITLSTVIYLREVSHRGTLVQTLLGSPAVRLALREERLRQRSMGVDGVSDRMQRSFGTPRDLASASAAILTALCLRAGRLLANKKVSLELAQRLTLAMLIRANRDLMAPA